MRLLAHYERPEHRWKTLVINPAPGSNTLAFSLTLIYVPVCALPAWVLLQIPVIPGLIAAIVAIPAGLLDAIATFLLAVGGGAALFGGGYALAKDALGSFGTLLQLKNDNSAFENGHCRRTSAVAEIGDGSNWHYKG
jgi:hypothetical protein